MWPAVFAEPQQPGNCDQLVDAELYTRDEVDEMRQATDGCLGWRLGIDAAGTWRFLVAGD